MRRRCRPDRSELAGPDACQQLVEHDAEGVDIGRGRDGTVLPLLGRTVFRRDEAHLGPRGSRPDVPRLRVEELRDAEIEQFHIAGSRDEDIRRFEVAVDDQGAMRVLHGITHHTKEPQPGLERQTTRRRTIR